MLKNKISLFSGMKFKYRYAYICFFLYNTCIFYLFLAFKQNQIVHYKNFSNYWIHEPSKRDTRNPNDWLASSAAGRQKVANVSNKHNYEILQNSYDFIILTFDYYNFLSNRNDEAYV